MDASDLLRASGWRPGRSVDITADVEAIEQEGFALNPAAEGLLREFSHLTIHMPGRANPLVVDGVTAARHAFVGWGQSYGAAIGQQVVPVGEYSNLTFWVAGDGGIWATFDDLYGRAGATLPEVIQGLFFEPDAWRLDRTIDD